MTIDQRLLQKVKTSLRRTHNRLDDDLSDTIAACLTELEDLGIQAYWDAHPPILAAVKLYCKAENTDDPVKAAGYRARYETMISGLAMTGEYKGAADE